jgi:hypothetical protein
MTSLDDKLAAVEASITRYEGMLETAATSEVRWSTLDVITERNKTLNLLLVEWNRVKQGK